MFQRQSNVHSRALAVLLAAAGTGFAATVQAADEPALTEDQKIRYAIGVNVGRSLRPFSLTPEEMELVIRGMSDTVAGKPALDPTAYNSKVQALANERRAAAARALIDKAAAQPGAVKTESGMVFVQLAEGKGASPAASDNVKVHYRGTLPDGTEFDSSFKRGEPAKFNLGGVIPCWTEGVAKMKPGGKALLVCPPNLAYGERATGGIPAGSTLTFEVELIEVLKKAQ